jgi:hypothetical protein
MNNKQILLTIVTLLLSLLFFLPSLNANENIPVPLEHWSYPIIEYFSTQGILNINLETKPITREQVIRSLSDIKNEYKRGTLDIDRIEDKLLSSLYEEYTPLLKNEFRNTPKTLYSNSITEIKESTGIGTDLAINGEESKYRAKFNTYLWGNVGKYITFAEQIKISRKKNPASKDTLGTRAWKDFRGTTPIAMFNLSFPHMEINAGRTPNWLGPGRNGTLLLSDNYPYFDHINSTIKIGKVNLSSFFTVINVDSTKYLSGHRIEIKDILGITVGFSEFVLYSGRIEPGYLNPLLIIYGEQYNRGDRDNIFWYFDFSANLPGKNLLYGEFLIDDFQYESTPPAPNKIAYTLGLHTTEPFNIPRLDLLFEYTRITNWVYTHKFSENTYSNYGVCLGHQLGPDGDIFNITLTQYIRWNIIPKLHFSYSRKGEGRIYESWEKGMEPHPPFPSGIVKSILSFDISLFIKPSRFLEIEPGWKTYKIENVHNVLDWKKQNNEFFLNLYITF